MKSPRGLFVLGLVCGMVALGAQSRLAAQQAAKAPAPQQPTAPAQPKPPSPAAQPVVAEPVKQAPTTPISPPVSAAPPAKGAAAVPARAPAGTVAAPAAAAPAIPSAAMPGDVPPATPATTAPDADRMPRGPSIHETGRVGRMGVSDSGVKIKHTQSVARPAEQQVQGQPARAERAAGSTATGGSLNQAALGRELRPKLTLLKDCRVQVARQKHLGATAITAGALTLRWTILPNGQVTDTEVVARSPVDGRVIDCVKRQMSVWSFTPPAGGPAQVERALKF